MISQERLLIDSSLQTIHTHLLVPTSSLTTENIKSFLSINISCRHTDNFSAKQSITKHSMLYWTYSPSINYTLRCKLYSTYRPNHDSYTEILLIMIQKHNRSDSTLNNCIRVRQLLQCYYCPNPQSSYGGPEWHPASDRQKLLEDYPRWLTIINELLKPTFSAMS